VASKGDMINAYKDSAQNVKGKRNLKDLVVDERIILKRILKKPSGRMRNGFI
jgi:hypothetical protein